MPAPSTVESFLDIVVKSGVLEKDTLDPYLQQMKAAEALPPSPSKLGAAMVRDGLLTRFQAGQFLQGKWRGFWISGKYKLLDHLGQGGMGNVYLCEHKVMRRLVAIKVLPHEQAKDPASLERFHREARAAAALDHPNIVRAHDVDHDGRHHFLVMEYVEGASLQDIVKQTGPMDVTRAAHYVRQAALGLHHAHEAGLVHRDVKPGNLLLDRQGVVKVLDMGLARFFRDHADTLTQLQDEKAILGTADYLAPEQAIDSHAVDIRADVYSLGATFYYLLAGRPPFGEGKTVAQKLLLHQMKEPTPLHELRAEAPEGLAAVVAKMMAKAPDDRYQTPADVYEALAEWTQAPIPPPPEDEMPKGGVRPRCGPDTPSQGVRTPPPGTSAPWLVTPKPTVFPSAEATGVGLAGGRRQKADVRSPNGRHPLLEGRRPLVLGGAALAVLLVLGTLVSWGLVRTLSASTKRTPPAPGEPAASAAGSNAAGGAVRADVAEPSRPDAAPLAVMTPAPGALSALCVLSVEDGKERVLLESADRWDSPVFTPDGKAVLCSSKGKLHRLSLADGSREVFPLGTLPASRDYAFSHDGQRMAITVQDAMWLLPAAGGPPAMVQPKMSGYLHGWTADGRSLLYVASRGGPLRIFSRPADGGDEEPLLAHEGFSDAPDATRDGKWIYYCSDKSGKVKVWRIPAAGAGPNDEKAEQVTDDGLTDWFPHPSPDGKWLLFLSDPRARRGVVDRAEVVLRLMPLPGEKPERGPVREVRRFFGGQGTINAPCWSPDGKSIAYVRYAPKK